MYDFWCHFLQDNALELCFIAEGIESEDELEFVKKVGVEAVQGYYFYRPMTNTSLMSILQVLSVEYIYK